MRLNPGTHIGAYEVTGLLGTGGMGEVYRARDTHLNRSAALKILPAIFAGDTARLARFKREAQTLAALNHPHIAQIYGLEESNGVCALAMEMVEGEELAQKIAHGKIPVDEAITIARQIAEALEAAHEKGIVHRDLKPANIKINKAGQVKVLDFGLATALQHDVIDSDLSQSPTYTYQNTQTGIILGTAPYMSPEQARGKPVDKRTDIWAFGVVLYEILTGKRLFAGETVSDVLAAVLRQEINLQNLGTDIPKRLKELLRRCLDRDPSQRLRDIGEARIALSHVNEPEKILDTPVQTTKSISLFPILLASAAIAVLAFLSGRSFTKAPTSPSIQSLSFSLVTDQPGVESQPSLSPDGRSLAFVKETDGQSDIYTIRVSGRNTILLTPDSPVDDYQPAFSPDGESIAFRSERSGGGIFVMGSTGESVRRITDFGFDPAWSPDGRKLVVSTAQFVFPQDRTIFGVLSVVDIATGEKHSITAADIDAVQPCWSPHGNRIAYWALRTGSGRRDLWTVAADGSELKTGGIALTDDEALDWSPIWSPDGKYIYFSSNRGGTLNLWRMPVDENSGRTLGNPEAITAPTSWAGDPSISKDGLHLAYSSLEWRSRLLKVSFDPDAGKINGAPVLILESSHPIRDHAISADGSWITYTAYVGGKEDIFLIKSDGTELRRLTDDSYRDRAPVWTPDGNHIAFYSDRAGNYRIWQIRPDGSGLQQLGVDSGAFNLPTFSPDGLQIAATDSRRGWSLTKLMKNSAPTAQSMPEFDSISHFWPLSWSADGRQLAGMLLTQGRAKDIGIFSLADSKFHLFKELGTGIWIPINWLNDSRRLMFRDRRGLFILDTQTSNVTPILSIGGYLIARSTGITPDNRTITYTETGTSGDIWMLELSTQKSK